MERPSHVTSCLVVVYMYLQVCSFAFQAQASQGGGTVFLERGHRGKVPCPPITSRKYAPGDIDAMYWYYGTTSSTALLISYFRGRVAPQNGIPHGIYDIDSEFSLVTENVTAKDEGIYHFMLKPRLQMVVEGQVEVCDKVSSRQPYPTVVGCKPSASDANQCEVPIDQTIAEHSLTCVMDKVKPAVELRWRRLYLGGSTALNASLTVKPVVLPAGTASSLRNNTYSTSASLQVNDVDDDAVYECEAVGVAVGSGSRMRVRFTKTVYRYSTVTHVVQLAFEGERELSTNNSWFRPVKDEDVRSSGIQDAVQDVGNKASTAIDSKLDKILVSNTVIVVVLSAFLVVNVVLHLYMIRLKKLSKKAKFKQGQPCHDV